MNINFFFKNKGPISIKNIASVCDGKHITQKDLSIKIVLPRSRSDRSDRLTVSHSQLSNYYLDNNLNEKILEVNEVVV